MARCMFGKLLSVNWAAIALVAGAGRPAVAQAEESDAAVLKLEEVVVTGTRIIRDGFESPTPLTVIGVDDLNRDAPQNIADAVNKLPQFSSSPSTRNTATSGDGTQGVNSLNLRALGASRTLVLLDGVRVVGSSINSASRNGGAVDINSFPDALIQRVDVVTGGASAAYGSDALAGVVNFVLDRNFTGVKGTAQGGVTTYGDGKQYLAGLTAGTGFANDRAHFLISGQRSHNDGVLDNDRKWATEGWNLISPNPGYTATNGQPFLLIAPQVGSAQFTNGGLITGGPLRGTEFGPGGSTRQFNYGAISNGALMSGGDWQQTLIAAGGGNIGAAPSLDSRMTRQNLFTRVSFDVTDDFQVFGQFLYSDIDSFANCCLNRINTTILSGNPFIPASVQAQMTALGVTSFPVSRNASHEVGGRIGTDDTRKVTQYLLGATGEFEAFGSGWSWDAHAARSTSQLTVRQVNLLIRPYYALATDVVTHPATGEPVCRSTLTDPNNGCVPYNPMGIGVNSAAALDYIIGEGHLEQEIRQDVAAMTVRGEPFSNWAGPVSVAFGVEHRKESVSGESSELDQAAAFFNGNYLPTFGSYRVSEGFIETVVPLLKDLPWAESLDLNAAARRTDYSTSGLVTTWKVGATYSPMRDLRFRATRSRDIRAPNLGESFQARQSSNTVLRDDFTGTTHFATQVLTGNPDLKPEEADMTGLGLVYQPSWAPGLSMSFDHFRIDIANAVQTSSYQATVDQCYAGNQALCEFVERDANGVVHTIYVTPSNTAITKITGFDVELGYSMLLNDIGVNLPGRLGARALATHVKDLLSSSPSSGQILEGAGVMDGSLGSTIPIAPDWRYALTLGYDSDAFSASWTGRGVSSGVHSTTYIGCTSDCPPSSPVGYTTINNNDMPGAFYMDLNLTYHLQKLLNADVFLTVENLANHEPHNVAFLGFALSPYDLLGRTYRAGVRFKM